jgi:RES domain-containing protein
MLLYRIAKTPYVRDLTGLGPKLHGGRWNHRGVPVIYTSESRSLATVEYLVHLSFTQTPQDLSIATLEIPDGASTKLIRARSLPKRWRDTPAPPELADVGSEWVRSGRTLLLRVPSAVVEHEHNVLINPAHREMRRVKLVRVEPLQLDERLTGARVAESLRSTPRGRVACRIPGR